MPITSFRRPVDAAVLHRIAPQDAPAPCQNVDKWEVLRELTVARKHFDLSDRDLTVLQALISFHRAAVLEAGPRGLVVYPSNKTICLRLNGMPCSTMRRHLANLVRSGLVARRDSPNGKRYVRRSVGEETAYGFDLSPLVLRFQEISGAASAARAAEVEKAALRESISLMRRDLLALTQYGQEARPDLATWDGFSDRAALTARALRRKLSLIDLQDLEVTLAADLETARAILKPRETEEMSTNVRQTEQHYQSPNSETDSLDREEDDNTSPASKSVDCTFNISLQSVLSACPEITSFSQEPVRTWHQLLNLADTVQPMMGFTPSVLQRARSAMGPKSMTIVTSVMLEKFHSIKSPNAYLAAITSQAEQGAFNPNQMLRIRI